MKTVKEMTAHLSAWAVKEGVASAVVNCVVAEVEALDAVIVILVS